MKEKSSKREEALVEKIDGRKHPRVVKEQMRKEAIRMRKGGMSRNEVARILGVSPWSVTQWWQAYQREGSKALKVQAPGAKEGKGRALTAEKERFIQRLLIDKSPQQLKFPFALWDRRGVQELIKREFSVTLSIRAVGNYLHRWGFTPQKPIKRAYEQRPVEVQAWVEEEYPHIKKRAKKEKAEIHWGDETGLRNTSQYGRSYAPRGQTPIQILPAKRVSTNIISTITNQGKVRFMGYHGSMNTRVLIRFCRRLIKDSPKKIFLILDNLRVHHAKLFQAWLQKYNDKIEVFYLPAYSPERNPDEYLNGDLKVGVHSKAPVHTAEELAQKAKEHLTMLQNNPERVKKYFQHPMIAYAAADEVEEKIAA